MEIDHLVQDVHHFKQQLLKISKGEPILIIFDDMINSDSVAELSNLCLMKYTYEFIHSVHFTLC